MGISVVLHERVNIREVVEENERLVLRTAYRLLGSWEDARDAAQEVFLKLHRSRDRFDDLRAVEPWLYRITVNTCRDMHRRRRPTAALAESPALDPSPEGIALLEQQRRMLHAALQSLPDGQRRAILLREIEGLSTEEVAGRLGSTAGNVRSLISLGRARLKKILAAAVAASVGLSVWMFWPHRIELAPPQPVMAQMPPAPLEFAKPARTRRGSRYVAKPEPIMMKLVSGDESIVIYWVMNQKGEDE